MLSEYSLSSVISSFRILSMLHILSCEPLLRILGHFFVKQGWGASVRFPGCIFSHLSSLFASCCFPLSNTPWNPPPVNPPLHAHVPGLLLCFCSVWKCAAWTDRMDESGSNSSTSLQVTLQVEWSVSSLLWVTAQLLATNFSKDRWPDVVLR